MICLRSIEGEKAYPWTFNRLPTGWKKYRWIIDSWCCVKKYILRGLERWSLIRARTKSSGRTNEVRKPNVLIETFCLMLDA